MHMQSYTPYTHKCTQHTIYRHTRITNTHIQTHAQIHNYTTQKLQTHIHIDTHIYNHTHTQKPTNNQAYMITHTRTYTISHTHVLLVGFSRVFYVCILSSHYKYIFISYLFLFVERSPLPSPPSALELQASWTSDWMSWLITSRFLMLILQPPH